ncbi:hypothetical protein VNO77_16207 [Canavalia gladiata]|uniref:Uncharacterized protein n=1 Tax=Canavalia gladiata TaxID=3824 RepID=A0AAN9M0K6_CANGL
MLISDTEGSLRINDDRRLSLIDVSSADDSLIANYLSENVEWLHTPNLNVLDPAELSSINEGVEKDKKHASPFHGNQEDVHKSCESNVAPVSANGKVPSAFQTGGSSKKVAASYNKASSSKSPSTGRQGIGKLTKKNPVFLQPPLKPVARRTEPSILKQPPNAQVKSGPSSIISSKRASPGDPHVKGEKDKAKRRMGGKVNSVTNTSVIKGSRVIAPKPTMSSKSPSDLSVTTKTKPTISPSSASNLSGNIGKSPLNSLKREVDARTKTPSSSCSVVRTPPKVASRDKIRSSDSSLSSISSVAKLSSSISPSSSSSHSSSESSTSIAKYRSNGSRTSFNSSTSRKYLSNIDARGDLNSQNCRRDSNLERKETLHTRFTSQRVRTAASEMVLPPAPKKPSGLQMPSPKIGLYDGVKSSVRTPPEGMQPHSVVPHSLPKHGAGSVSRTDPEEVHSKMHLKAGVGNLDADNTVAEQHLISTHDLNLGSTQENSQYSDQVDCLS